MGQRRGAVLRQRREAGAVLKPSPSKRVEPPKPTGKYSEVIQEARNLKRGEGFRLMVPKGVTAKEFINRVGVVLRLANISVPRGWAIRRRDMLDGSIIVRMDPILSGAKAVESVLRAVRR